jgi:hypothetical protein
MREVSRIAEDEKMQKPWDGNIPRLFSFVRQ